MELKEIKNRVAEMGSENRIIAEILLKILETPTFASVKQLQEALVEAEATIQRFDVLDLQTNGYRNKRR